MKLINEFGTQLSSKVWMDERWTWSGLWMDFIFCVWISICIWICVLHFYLNVYLFDLEWVVIQQMDLPLGLFLLPSPAINSAGKYFTEPATNTNINTNTIVLYGRRQYMNMTKKHMLWNQLHKLNKWELYQKKLLHSLKGHFEGNHFFVTFGWMEKWRKELLSERIQCSTKSRPEKLGGW